MSAPLFPADPLECVPLFAPAGGLLPTKLAQQYFGDRLFNPLTLFVFPGAQGAVDSTCVRRPSHASSGLYFACRQVVQAHGG